MENLSKFGYLGQFGQIKFGQLFDKFSVSKKGFFGPPWTKIKKRFLNKKYFGPFGQSEIWTFFPDIHKPL